MLINIRRLCAIIPTKKLLLCVIMIHQLLNAFLLKLLFVLSPPLTVIPCFIGESKNPKTIPQENANADNIKISLFFILIPLVRYSKIAALASWRVLKCFP